MRAFKSRSDLAALTILLLAVIAAFADVLFGGSNLYFRDFSTSWYPSRIILRDILRTGSVPYWNALWSAGQPFAANPAYLAFYPLQWIALLPDARFAIHFQICIHYLLAAAGMYVLLRGLSLRPPAALFGAFTWAFGGTLISLSNLPAALFAAAWMPWLGHSFRRLILTPSAKWFCAASLILGTILLTGEQSLILQSGFLIGAFALREKRVRPLLIAAAIIIAATLIASVQIAPALDLERHSARAEGLSYGIAGQWSLPLVRPLELAFPSLFDRFDEFIFFWGGLRLYGDTRLPWMLSFYPGLLACILMITGFVVRARGALWIGVVAMASYAMAIGVHGPLFPLLFRIGFRSLRYPEKFFITALFVLTIFAAFVAERILDDERAWRAASVIAAIVLLADGARALSAFFPSYDAAFAKIWGLTGYYGDLVAQSRQGAWIDVAMATALIVVLLLRVALPRSVWIALLGVFVLIDLGSRVTGLAPRVGPGFYDPPPLARALAGKGEVRIYNDADWRRRFFPKVHIPAERQWWVLRNAMRPETQSIWGFGAVLEEDIAFANLRPMVDFTRAFWSARFTGRDDRIPLLLAMAGVTHVIEERPGEASASLAPARLVALPRNARCYFADQITGAPPLATILSRVPLSPHVAFTDLRLNPAPGRVLDSRERPNALDLDVEAAGDALLVIAVTRDKYWRATIDGAPAPIHPANLAFQSIVVPRGRHHVALRYLNPLMTIFGIVSIVSVAAVAGAALRSRAPRPPSPH